MPSSRGEAKHTLEAGDLGPAGGKCAPRHLAVRMKQRDRRRGAKRRANPARGRRRPRTESEGGHRGGNGEKTPAAKPHRARNPRTQLITPVIPRITRHTAAASIK